MSLSRFSRRNFLQVAGGVGATLILGCRLGVAKTGSPATAPDFEPNVFIRIDSNGRVTLVAPRPELGTGVRTSLPMILAEELGVDWQGIVVEQAPADRRFGAQGIGGSQSLFGSYKPLRTAAATAATLLKTAAGTAWGVPAAMCILEDGEIKHKASGKHAPIGAFVAAAAALPKPDPASIIFKDPKDYRYVGKPMKRIDNLAVATGKATFGSDIRVKDMRFAVIVRPQAFGGSMKSFDDSACKAVSGFVMACKVAHGVAVVGKDTWSAMKAAAALKVVWDPGPDAALSSADLTARFRKAVQPFPTAPAGAAKTIEAVYELPYLAHASMEPMICTVSLLGGRCEVWASTQSPAAALREAVQASGLPATSITVHVPLVGGGFGRRLSQDYISECIEIAHNLGEPVQLVWTRTDDFQHDFYRPMTYHALQGSIGSDGAPVAFHHQALVAGGRDPSDEISWGDLEFPYAIPDAKLLRNAIASPVPTGAWRSVDATFLAYAQECFLDELCAAAGKDPVETRLALMKDERLKRTLQLAAEKSGWGTPMKKGWGRGVACYSGFNSSVTQVAEVEVVGNKVKVRRMVAAVDCGYVVNPLGVEAQIQGATTDAVSTFLYSAITIKEGGVAEANWDDFQWARMEDAPAVVVYLTTQEDHPTGIGEPGYPPSIAAIGNAVFAACGKRIRRLPLDAKDLA